MEKRLVFEYTTGRFAGLRQIQGAMAPPIISSPLTIQLTTHAITMNLVTIAPRYVLYREEPRETDLQRVSPQESTPPAPPVG